MGDAATGPGVDQLQRHHLTVLTETRLTSHKWIVTVGTCEARSKSLVLLPRMRLRQGDRL